MKTKYLLIPILLATLSILISCNSNEEIAHYSPDGKIKTTFIIEEGIPKYTVEYENRTVIDTSLMGFELKDQPSLTSGFTIEELTMSSNYKRWEPLWGEYDRIWDRNKQLLIRLKEKEEPFREIQIEFKAFNSGLGFRYIFPEQESLKDFEIMDELTQFKFAENYKAWWIPGDWDSYEHLYKATLLDEIDTCNTPVTFQSSDSIFISIHEANLTDYAGMTLARDKEDELLLYCDLVPWPDGVKVKVSETRHTPWRTIQIADNPGDLIETAMIQNLNEPNKLENTSWISPMKYVGIWWGMHIRKNTWHSGPNHGATTEEAMRYIDFASENDISGLLIEGWNSGWDSWFAGDAFDFTTPYEDFDLEKIVEYADDNGVKLIGHHETGGNIPLYEKHIDEAFKLYQDLGIHAVKTGYAGKIRPEGYHHHGQWMVNHYRMVLEKAAEYEIMIDAHEPIKPTGIRRTYPNMMTREGVRGQEYNAWSAGNPPTHTCTLPFTRMLAGPLDYTPGIFDLDFKDYKDEERVHTTLAHQLALFVVLYSPLQMAADLVENYEDHPAFQFIREVPSDWDDTEVLNASIGEYITIARNKNDDWYVGSITNEEARELTITLDFLEDETDYRAVIYADGPTASYLENPYEYEILKKDVKKGDELILKLASGGGQAIMLEAR